MWAYERDGERAMTHFKVIGNQIDTQDSPDRFCKKMREWAALMVNAERVSDGSRFAQAWQEVELAISKSCLLSRTLYGNENPSETPCPVHKGKWSGIHIGWPETRWADGSPVKESDACRTSCDRGAY